MTTSLQSMKCVNCGASSFRRRTPRRASIVGPGMIVEVGSASTPFLVCDYCDSTYLEEAPDDGARRQLEAELVQREIIRACQDAGGMVELLMPHLANQLRIREVPGHGFAVVAVNGDEDVRCNLSGRPLTVGELVAEMRRDKHMRKAFARL